MLNLKNVSLKIVLLGSLLSAGGICLAQIDQTNRSNLTSLNSQDVSKNNVNTTALNVQLPNKTSTQTQLNNLPQAPHVLNAIGDLLLSLTSASKHLEKSKDPNHQFYTLGIGGKYGIEAKFDKFKLGCASHNTNCEIDIDQLHLKGENCQKGKPCYAQVDEPSIQFAFKNANQLDKRQVVGLRLFLDDVRGDLTAGQDNNQPFGINRYSGFIQIKSTKGRAKTSDSFFGSGANGEAKTVGTAYATILGCTLNCNKKVQYEFDMATTKGLYIPQLDVEFTIPNFTIEGSNLDHVVIPEILSIIPDVVSEGHGGFVDVVLQEPVCVTPAFCLSRLRGFFDIVIHGILAHISLDEKLSYIHRLPLHNTPFYVGVQLEPLQWPQAIEVAQTGWWLSFQKPIDLGYVYAYDLVDMGPMYPSLGKQLSIELSEKPVNAGTVDGIAIYTTGNLKQNIGTYVIKGRVDMPLKNIPIGNKNFWPNWPSVKEKVAY